MKRHVVAVLMIGAAALSGPVLSLAQGGASYSPSRAVPDPIVPKDGAQGITGDLSISGDLTISGTCTGCADGAGDVSGPASSTDGSIAAFDGTTGKLLKASGVSFTGGSNLDFGSTFVLRRAGVSKLTCNASACTVSNASLSFGDATATGTVTAAIHAAPQVKVSTSTPPTCASGTRGALVNVDGAGAPGALCWCTDDGVGGFAYQKLNPSGATACP